MAKGVIYILTNPSFENYVKIGYADDMDSRLKQLNNSECIPFAFRVYATYEVEDRLQDLRLHNLIDKLNPDLRSIDTVDGKKRVREFYSMSPEDAYDMLEAIAEISGTKDRLKKHRMTEAEKAAEVEAENNKRKRRPNYDFQAMGIPVGAMIECVDNPSIKAKVVDSRRVEYEGEVSFLTGLTRRLAGLRYDIQPSSHWRYNGKTLDQYYEETYGEIHKESL